MNRRANFLWAALSGACVFSVLPLGCGGGEESIPAVDRSRYEADLRLIAKERVPASAHWQAVQDLCKSRLEQLGFAVTLHKYATGVNVVGKLAGTTHPREEVFVSAHYDHIKGCAGADDNGSGVAGALEAARALSARRHPRTLVVACWDEEEKGLVGSLAYTEEAAARKDQIITSFVLEMIGYRSTAAGSQQIPTGFEGVFPTEVAEIKAGGTRGDFIAAIYNNDDAGVNAAAAAEMTASAGRSGLKLYALGLTNSIAPLLSAVMRSDHASFWLRSYPAFMITDSANYRNSNYHCGKGADTPDTLDHAFAAQVIQSTVDAAVQALQGPAAR